MDLWDDPVELRMQLVIALVEIAELREENDQLKQLLLPLTTASGERDT
ncbi:hypothetical protein ACIBH1_37860 [Nonomuraea sp. NPDC050663]